MTKIERDELKQFADALEKDTAYVDITYDDSMPSIRKRLLIRAIRSAIGGNEEG